MEPMIRVEKVSKRFITKAGPVDALENVSFEVEKGDIFGIIGLSGAGKSTMVRCLNLLEQPSEGRVLVDGKNLMELPDRELRKARQNIGMIFQHFNLLMQRNVLDNVCFPMEIAGVKRKEAKARAMELLKTVGLEEKAKAYPSQLSGGQKQRVAIARVLANNPQILLCDEATSALDPQTTKSILTLLKSINETYGITIVVITHEMSVVQEICRHVAVLDHGHLAEYGTVKDLFHSPKTEAARKLILSGPQQIERMRGKRLIRVTFSNHSAFEPMIGNVILEYKTPLNILYADTKTIDGNAEGEMILQLPESKEIADQMIQYFIDKNLGVEELKDYVG
ncbi:MAG: ATP-binding cassette domain-containing protein [Lachnospiraceae bacterium]|nr:ATP-binding cassette domain-containing protein [Robinsoniella sp.]MDY3765551.1 ATP-binding cassette domain-containing protein [Lachnospiraceae bacterium]